MSTRYQLGTQYRIACEFLDEDGAAVDPTTVRLYTVDPNDSTETYVYGTDVEVQREEEGSFFYLWTPDTAGHWTFRWDGEGAAVVESRDTNVRVESTRATQRQ
jgi:hypothetical protein